MKVWWKITWTLRDENDSSEKIHYEYGNKPVLCMGKCEEVVCPDIEWMQKTLQENTKRISDLIEMNEILSKHISEHYKWKVK